MMTQRCPFIDLNRPLQKAPLALLLAKLNGQVIVRGIRKLHGKDSLLGRKLDTLEELRSNQEVECYRRVDIDIKS